MTPPNLINLNIKPACLPSNKVNFQKIEFLVNDLAPKIPNELGGISLIEDSKPSEMPDDKDVIQKMDEQGHSLRKLNTPLLYRGDTRGPPTVFSNGFQPHKKTTKITELGASYGLIALTENLNIAVGFANRPGCYQGYLACDGYLMPSHSWVYLVYAENGYDVRGEPKCTSAKLAQEVCVSSVHSTRVVAAFQIKVAKCEIFDFLKPTVNQFATQLLVTAFAINPNADHNVLSINGVKNSVSEMQTIFAQSFYANTCADQNLVEPDFPYTYDMTLLQKELFRQGFPREDIYSNWITQNHLDAARSGIRIEDLRQTSSLVAYALEKNIEKKTAVRFQTNVQVDGLLFGFTLDDVLSPWYSMVHLSAAREGVRIEDLRQTSSVGIYALKNKIEKKTAVRFQSRNQVDGYLFGFTLDDVLSPWYSIDHLSAARERVRIEDLRQTSSLVAYALKNKIEKKTAVRFQSRNQVDGYIFGFTPDDVLSPWYSIDHLSAAREGVRIEDLRQTSSVGIYALKKKIEKKTAVRFQSLDQVEGYLLKFTVDDVLSPWYSINHLSAARNGIRIEDLRQTSSVGVYALEKNIEKQTAFRFQSRNQVDGYLLKFTVDDVLSPWYSINHLSAAREGVRIEDLRQTSSVGAYALEKNIEKQTAVRFQSVDQVDGYLFGFPLDDVLSPWYSIDHLSAARKRVRIEDLRQTSRVVAYALEKNIEKKTAVRFQSLDQVDGYLLKFTVDDVLSHWYSWRHLDAARKRVPIEDLRQKSNDQVNRILDGFTRRLA